MKAWLAKVIARIAKSWFSILLALAPTVVFALGAVLIHFKTDIAYRLLQSEAAMRILRYVRPGILTASVMAITVAIIWLRKTKPHLGKKPFALLFLAPVALFVSYVSWAPTLLVVLVVGVFLFISQLPLMHDVADAYQRKSRLFNFLLTMQGISLFLFLIFGIMLWVHVRDRAYANAQWIEIRAKGIYGEFSDIRMLAQNPGIEYALIRDPKMRFQKIESHRFGSGEDAYTVTYAMLGNGDPESADPANWPLWYYCGSGGCYDKPPLLVNVDLCPNPKDCTDDFAWVIRRVRFRIQNSDTTPPYPQTLRLLSPAGDLTLTEQQWQMNIRFAARLALYLQLAYFLFHALLAILNRVLKQPAGRS